MFYKLNFTFKKKKTGLIPLLSFMLLIPYIYIYMGFAAEAFAEPAPAAPVKIDGEASFTISSNSDDADFVIGSTSGILPNDAIRNPNGIAIGFYLKGDTLGKTLDVTVDGGKYIKYEKGTWPGNQVYIMGNYQSAVSGTGQYDKLVNPAGGVTDNYSQYNHGGVVNLTLNPNAKFYSLIYGGRNDLSQTHEQFGGDPNFGNSCDNTVNINLGLGATLGTSIIYGGRSAQAEGALWDGNPDHDYSGDVNRVNVRVGYMTDSNKVIIRGDERDFKKYGDPDFDNHHINLNIASKGGVFGAEGYQTNHNYVSLDYVNVGAPNDLSRDLGIIGGRGLYNFRIYNENESAISNQNIVVVRNSNIATGKDSIGHNGLSVVGGYSYGQARNNIVAIDNATINGHVYGGIELMGVAHLAPGDQRRELHSNLVSLHNTQLIGNSSVYGTATADAKTYAESSNVRPPERAEQAIDELTLKAVNRRRGIVYIGGSVKAASVFARYVHFGSYVDTNRLQAGHDYKIFKDYYPSGGNVGIHIDNVLPTVNTTGSEEINLNQLVAGSYLDNNKGFHSSLAQQDAKQSNSTNGQHNFWVAAFANISSRVRGDGTNLNSGEKGKHLYRQENSQEVVNHEYQGGDLSILAMDDGLILANEDADQSIMHNFRNYYDGLVLYLGVHNGKKIDNTTNMSSVVIAFDEIDKFRKDNNQGVNAFGNTQVGLFIDGYGQSGVYNDDPYMKAPVTDINTQNWSDMVISIPNFSIEQGGTIVAEATFGFYKYLHFDGDLIDWSTTPSYTIKSDMGYEQPLTEGDVKVSKPGEQAGVGIKYWLKSLTIRDGHTLTLNGRTDDSSFADNDPDSRSSRSTYTLSAYVTGNGNVRIASGDADKDGDGNPDGNTVIMGDNRPYRHTIDTQIYSGTTYVPQVKIGENQYTGFTTVESNAHLIQGADGALGSETVYTRGLNVMGDNSRYSLQGHNQLVGALFVNGNTGKEALVNLSDEAVNDSLHETIGNVNAGLLRVKGYAFVGEDGQIKGKVNSRLGMENGYADVYSSNADMIGTFSLAQASRGNLHHEQAFSKGRVSIDDARSELDFLSAARTNTVGAMYNAGHVYLSDRSKFEDKNSLHDVKITGGRQTGEDAYTGAEGSVIHYRGLIQGEDNGILGHSSNSIVDVIHADTAAGTSEIMFGEDLHHPYTGIFSYARGERVVKENGIPVFIIANRNVSGSTPLELTMNPIGIVAKEDEGYEWVYSLGYNDVAGTQRDWVLYNSIGGKDAYFPRPEPGAYVAAAMSWSRMHMRLHDRFGQAYETDPFDAAHKPQSAWIRQEGRRAVFDMSDGMTHTKSLTSLTQVGGDVIRKEINDVWKYNLGFFTGDLYNRSKSRTWNIAKARSNGYGLGVYGTLYTGNSPDDGFYIDSWLMYNHFDNKIYGNGRPAFYYNASGWAASLESGLTLPLGETGKKSENKTIWTLQPEVQVIWDGVEAHKAVDSVGTPYKQLGDNNVVFRAGARLHANAMNKGLGYIEANWIHNTHEYGVMLGETPVYMEGGRNLGEVRMGLEGRLSDDGNCLGWLTVGTQRGSHDYHNDMIQVGLRYMF